MFMKISWKSLGFGKGKPRNIHENVMEISGGFETLFLDQHADDWNMSAIPSPPLTNTVCGKILRPKRIAYKDHWDTIGTPCGSIKNIIQ